MALAGIGFLFVLLSIPILAPSFPMGVHAAPAIKLGVVRHIDGGLQLQPPHQRSRHGRVRDELFDAYRLSTARTQRASLGFVDGTVLHMNQRTNLILGTLDHAVLNRGELEMLDRRPRLQIVRTNAAVAVATGTDFDVRIEFAPSKFPPGSTTVSVISGTVRVSNRAGSTLVHANQWTHVSPGRAPTRPTTHPASRDIAWARGLPAP